LNFQYIGDIWASGNISVLWASVEKKICTSTDFRRIINVSIVPTRQSEKQTKMIRKHFKVILLVFIVLSIIPLGYYSVRKSTEYRQIAGVRYYTSENISNLAVLCKVWGFLKYYHPDIVEGKYIWDPELIMMMPSILKAKSKGERNNLLSKWVDSIGKVEQGTIPVISPDSVKMYPDLDWIDDKKELGVLSAQLEKIKTAKRPFDESHYVELKKGIGNPVFLNEDIYPQMSYPNASYRLLALFRYWNIIQYYFPYKYLIGEKWDNVLTEFIPQFINAKNELEYKLTVLKLIARIHDSHAFMSDPIIEKFKGNYIVPLHVSFVENKPVITDSLDLNIEKGYPLKIGDVILKINGKPVEKIISERLAYTPGSNLSCQLRNLGFDLLRSKTNNITVSFMRGDQIFIKKIPCYPNNPANAYNIYQKNKPLYQLLSNGKNIGYLYLGSSIGGTVPDLKNTIGLIIDLRCYPNSEKVKDDKFQLYGTPAVFVKFTSVSHQQPGLFKYLAEHSSSFDTKNDLYKEKVIIIVNELTQSHTEFLAMSCRCDPNAVVIGSTTAGADGDISWISLPGNIQTAMSGIGVYYPNGKETQRIGIVPDIVVNPTIKGISEGRDEVLEKAIELITKRN